MYRQALCLPLRQGNGAQPGDAVPAPARSSPAVTALSVRPLLPVPAEPAPTSPKRRQAAGGGGTAGLPRSALAAARTTAIFYCMTPEILAVGIEGTSGRRGLPDSCWRSALRGGFPKLIRFCAAAGGSGTTWYRRLLALPQAQAMPSLPSSSSRERQQLPRE